jgi:hypothetical protein
VERSNEDIIAQLREAVKMQNALIKSQNKAIAYWQDQAMALLDRDVENAIYGKSRLEILGATHEV